MTLPSIDDFDSLGGEKIDYSEVEDPDTDLSAEASDKARADVAAMTRMIARATVPFTTDGYVSTDFDSVWGNSAEYAPTAIAQGLGLWRLEFPASVFDARGEEHFLNLRWAHGQVEDLTSNWSVRCKPVESDPNFMDVAIFDSSGNLGDPATDIRIVIWVY